MAIATENNFKSVAFPAISCGIYGYPLDAAVEIAVDEVVLCLNRNTPVNVVIFCCFDESLSSLYRLRLEARGQLG
jgi:O-acetyl-ADP-ribose deacetylase (regulator of RNase III)